MPRTPSTFILGTLAAALILASAGCSSSSSGGAASAVATNNSGGSATTTTVAKAATATPGDAFCSLEEVAREAGLAISTSQSDPTTLQAQVVAALDASKAAAAIAPADFVDIATATVAQQEGVAALLKQYDYSFAKALASEEGNAFFSDPSLGEVKARRDAYLQEHCNLAPTANTSSGGGISLSPGDEGIRELFQLLRLGGQVQISDQQIDCAVTSLSGVLSEADLQAIGAGTTVSDAGSQAFVDAISTCGITIPQG
jgi:hypothetical protein